MEPTQQIDILEDLLEYLIAEGETVALQRLRQLTEGGTSGLILSLAGKENEDEAVIHDRQI